jgi:hypothetical protein
VPEFIMTRTINGTEIITNYFDTEDDMLIELSNKRLIGKEVKVYQEYKPKNVKISL